MTLITDDERRAGYVAAMGSELGNLHHDLENEAAHLLRKWGEFGVLFNGDPKQLDLLNQVASNFFFRLQQQWYEDAMLHISRLTDPPESGGRRQENLTIRRLPGHVSEAGFRAQIEESLDVALTKCQFARTWRDKRLAHSDLMFSGKNSLAGLPVATRTGVENAVESICAPITLIGRHFGFSSALSSFRDPWGVQSLLAHLRRAVRTH